MSHFNCHPQHFLFTTGISSQLALVLFLSLINQSHLPLTQLTEAALSKGNSQGAGFNLISTTRALCDLWQVVDCFLSWMQ